jgi:histidyl-tRNA synthetase
LAELFDAEPTTSTGFAIGFDRVLMALKKQETEIPVHCITAYVIPMGEEAKKQGYNIAHNLRKERISCDVALTDRNIAKHLKYANSQNVRFAIIIGEDELASFEATIKDMKSGEQKKVNFKEIVNHIKTT